MQGAEENIGDGEGGLIPSVVGVHHLRRVELLQFPKQASEGL